MGEVQIEQRGRVLLATVSNPPHALMDDGIVAGLDELVRRADTDPEVGAVVLTGAHPERFIAHYDIRILLEEGRNGPSVNARVAKGSLRLVGALRRLPAVERGLTRTPAGGLVALERFHDVLLRINRCRAVFVVAINGSTMGGGCELSLACDIRMMAEGQHGIGQLEILLGFPPGGGGTQRLARLLGSGPALRLILDGGPLTPSQALELGLIDELVSADQLVDRAVALAQRLGARPKDAIGACKRDVYEGGSLPLPEGLLLERSQFIASLGIPDAQQAMEAYVDGFETTGHLPAYDTTSMTQALDAGRFERWHEQSVHPDV
jgi:enoyl-CoA hydratase/carnithine racemase